MANAIYEFFQTLWFVPLDDDVDEVLVDDVLLPDNIEPEINDLETPTPNLTSTFLRTRHVLSPPGRLQNTPTKSHQPFPRPAKAPGKAVTVARTCPECRRIVRVHRKSYDISKAPRRYGRQFARYITVHGNGKDGLEDEEYLVEDLSPRTRLRPNQRMRYY